MLTSNPFPVKSVVSVIRTAHGWYDGALTATVTEANPRNGHWSYVVRDDEGNHHVVKHQRDLRKR